MTASMTITLTEDDAPDDHVVVDFEFDGFDIEDAQTNGNLPAALLLVGAAMLRVADELPSVRGRPVPPPTGYLPGRTRH